ncbi:hypothetical protein, conserved [Trypanosoma brucei gambiense DAL972]|uniref:Selenoprotein F/M domain-containing protein n=2 Tax=Trypanosoma brucei TaxID=5691 RepID=D0A5T6_TRYB9|nr:hypothetical protein, conserved [Trypanosoma brucei gambiense DAL972]CBH17037.1 hypothetical protein, conserved [Trypanosoma brucei gambiense DAL972]|eukprot:XP_011779301.1 hypothetical protein, conserved [Trypanosoma brucei gambiense DAL972]
MSSASCYLPFVACFLSRFARFLPHLFNLLCCWTPYTILRIISHNNKKEDMMCNSFVALLVSLALSRGSFADVDIGDSKGRPADECRLLGFDKPSVRCGHCTLLKQHTTNFTLYEECLSCCVDEKVPQLLWYATARLVVKSKSRDEPDREVDKFLAKYRNKFGNRLQVVNSAIGQPTHLIMVGDRGTRDAQWVVEDWSVSSLHDYLVRAFNMETEELL